ncbi:MAG: DUF6531 domain-containing protein [Verrucomicrobiota bacterium]
MKAKLDSSPAGVFRAFLRVVVPTILFGGFGALQADVPAPVIRQFQSPNTNGMVVLRWDAVAGCGYRVLTTTNLTGGVWTPVDYLVAATNSVTWQAGGQGGAAGYYRLATDANAITAVEPTIISTGAVTTVYIAGQGFGSNDVLQLTGPGGTLILTNRVVVSPTLISVVIGPGFTPDVPGSYQFQVISGSSGQAASSGNPWTVSASPPGALSLLEPPEPPPAAPYHSPAPAYTFKLVAVKTMSWAHDDEAPIGSQSSGSGAGRVTFNPFTITRKADSSNRLRYQLISVKNRSWAHEDESPKESRKLVAVKTLSWSHDDESPKETASKLVAVKTISWAHDDESPKETGKLVAVKTIGWSHQDNSPKEDRFKLVAVKTMGWAHDDESPKETGKLVAVKTIGWNHQDNSPKEARFKLVAVKTLSWSHDDEAPQASRFKLVAVKTLGWAHDDESPKETASKLVAVKTIGWAHDDEAPKETVTFESSPYRVVPSSGEVQGQVADLVIPGRGLDFVWARTYRSRTALPGGMSPGWTHSYDVSVSQTSGGVVVADGTGRGDLYSPGANGVYSRPDVFNEGRLSNSVFTLTFPDTGRWVFNPLDGTAAAGKLAQITDRNGNTMALGYDTSGRLVQVVDDLGRTNTVSYNTSGQLAAVTDFSGRSVAYQYYGASDTAGSPGDLKSVTSPPVSGTPNGNDFPDGKTVTYTYSTGYANEAENHLLLSVKDPAGQTACRYVYQHNQTNLEFLRCVSVQDGGNDPVYYTHAPQVAAPGNGYATIKVTMRDAMGNVSECLYNSRNLPVDLKEYTGRAPVVGPVTDTVNRPVNPVRGTDPAFFETQLRWNQHSLCVSEMEPRGNGTDCVYECDLSPDAGPRKQGDLRVERTRPFNSSPTTGDLELIIQRLAYDPRFGSPGTARKVHGIHRGEKLLDDDDFVTSATDPNGNVTTAAYDARGNRVKVHFYWDRSGGADKDFAYNGQGQLTAVTNAPDGQGYRAVTLLGYSASGPAAGYLQSVTEDANGLALTTQFEGDARGNLTRCIDPRGNDWLYTYNSLDQLVQARSPGLGGGGGGAVYRIATQYTYDANGNLVRVDLDNRDSTGALDASVPQWTTQYGYDSLNRCVQVQRNRDASHSVVAQYQYDANDNLILARSPEAVNGDSPDNVVGAEYDERNLPFRVTAAPGTTLGGTNEFTFDANGNIASLEFNGQVDAACVYDGFDRPVSVTDAMGNVAACTYDANGNVLSSSVQGEVLDVPGSAGNQLLAQASYRYDGLDRCVQTVVSRLSLPSLSPIGSGQAVTTIAYAPNGESVSVTDDNGHTTSFGYDTAGRLALVTDPKGNTAGYSYDAAGNVLGVTETDHSDLGGPPQVFTLAAQYDAMDRCVQVSDNAGNTETCACDSRSLVVRQTDANGHLSGCVYDGLGRCTLAIADLDGDGLLDFSKDAGTAVGYDDNGCVLSVTDANTNTTVFAYDARDRCVQETFADGSHCSLIWSPRSNLESVTDPNGSTVVNTYDARDRLVHRDLAARNIALGTTTFENFAYDGCSRLVLAANDVSQRTLAYDTLGDCTGDTQDGLTTAFACDGMGNCLSITHPGGRVVNYTYDAADQVSSVSSSAGGGLPPVTLATYSYDGPGRLARISRANGVNTRVQWNGIQGAPNAAGDYGWAQPSGVNHTGPGNIILDQRRLAYDANQNKILRKQMVEFSPGQGTLTNIWGYNALNMLDQSAATRGASATDTTDYGLDAVGNRSFVSRNGLPFAYTRSSAIPPGDFQMDRYTTTPFGDNTYDPNGNLVQVSSATGQATYGYDYADRLVQAQILDFSSGAAVVTQLSFSYDALGNRISKTVYSGVPLAPVTTYYLRSGCKSTEVCGNGIIDTLEGGPTGSLQHEYCYGGRLASISVVHQDKTPRLACFSGTGALDHYYLCDDLGNTLALADAGGAVLERYEYDDYGAPQFLTSDGLPMVGGDGLPAKSSSVGNPFLFHGMEWDPETALYLNPLYKGSGSGSNPLYEDPKTGRATRGKVKSVRDMGGSFDGNNPWSGGAEMKGGTVKFFNVAKGF